jgi:hypothetical protein
MKTTPQDDQASLARALQARIAALEAELEALQAQFPAHTIPPAMIAKMDELDEALERARQALAALGQPGGEPGSSRS